LEAAVLLGSRVRGLVWVDVYRSLGEPDGADDIEAFIAPFRVAFAARADEFVRGLFTPTADPDLVDWVAADMAAAPLEVAIDALRHSIGNEGPAVAVLDRLSFPIVAINPDYRPTDEPSLLRHGVRSVIATGV